MVLSVYMRWFFLPVRIIFGLCTVIVNKSNQGGFKKKLFDYRNGLKKWRRAPVYYYCRCAMNFSLSIVTNWWTSVTPYRPYAETITQLLPSTKNGIKVAYDCWRCTGLIKNKSVTHVIQKMVSRQRSGRSKNELILWPLHGCSGNSTIWFSRSF